MYRKLLVGTDGSETAARAVDRAVALAADLGATVTIASAGPGDRPAAVVAAEATRHAGAGVVIDTAVVEVDPVSGLVELAGAGGYDLLVVGNKGMTGLSRFFRLGSVPSKLSHHLPCNLLVVRTT